MAPPGYGGLWKSVKKAGLFRCRQTTPPTPIQTPTSHAYPYPYALPHPTRARAKPDPERRGAFDNPTPAKHTDTPALPLIDNSQRPQRATHPKHPEPTPRGDDLSTQARREVAPIRSTHLKPIAHQNAPERTREAHSKHLPHRATRLR